LSRRKRIPARFDLDRVAAAAGGYSGAEIDAAVQTALYAAFSQVQTAAGKSLASPQRDAASQNCDLTTQTLLAALSRTVPLSTTRSEEIEALREWARLRAVPASVADAKAERAYVCS